MNSTTNIEKYRKIKIHVIKSREVTEHMTEKTEGVVSPSSTSICFM